MKNKFAYLKRYGVTGQILWKKSFKTSNMHDFLHNEDDISLYKIEFTTKSGETLAEIFIEDEFDFITNEYWKAQLENDK